MGEEAVKMATKIAHDMGIPTWGLVAILIGVGVVILGICFCCIRRCFRKRRSKDGKKGMKGVDLKSVQLLGSAYKEKVMLLGVMLKITVRCVGRKNFSPKIWETFDTASRSFSCFFLSFFLTKKKTLALFNKKNLHLCLILPSSSIRWIFTLTQM